MSTRHRGQLGRLPPPSMKPLATSHNYRPIPSNLPPVPDLRHFPPYADSQLTATSQEETLEDGPFTTTTPVRQCRSLDEVGERCASFEVPSVRQAERNRINEAQEPATQTRVHDPASCSQGSQAANVINTDNTGTLVRALIARSAPAMLETPGTPVGDAQQVDTGINEDATTTPPRAIAWDLDAYITQWLENERALRASATSLVTSPPHVGEGNSTCQDDICDKDGDDDEKDNSSVSDDVDDSNNNTIVHDNKSPVV